MLSPALILACTSVDVFVPGITISGNGGRNRTVYVKLHTSHAQDQGGAPLNPSTSSAVVSPMRCAGSKPWVEF